MNKHFDEKDLTGSDSFSRGLPNNCWRFYSGDIQGFRKCGLPWFHIARKCSHISFLDLTPVISASVTARKEGGKANLTNQGIVRGLEHSCLTLVQSRKEARGVDWIKLAGKEEGEKSRRDRLYLKWWGWVPDSDVIPLLLDSWVVCMSLENLVFLFFCVCVCANISCLFYLSI